MIMIYTMHGCVFYISSVLKLINPQVKSLVLATSVHNRSYHLRHWTNGAAYILIKILTIN